MKVALYARVSSERQAEKDLSIPSQLKALREHAAKQGWAVVREFVDEAQSARTADRPAFQEMIGLAKQKSSPFQAIVVWNLSRFARNREDSVVYKSLLRQRGIQVLSFNERFDDSATGRFYEAITEAIDEFYSIRIGQDTLRGMRENAQRGFWNGSLVRFGFRTKKVNDGNGNPKNIVVVNEAEARVVREIFRLYPSGMGAKAIAKRFNEKGISYRGKQKWDRQRILDILGQPAYAGRLYFNRENHRERTLKPESEWVLFKVPPIVDESVFKRVQEIKWMRDPNRTNPAITSSPTLLSGLVKCGLCGASMTLETGKGGRYRYYNCRDFLRKGPTACKGQRVPAPLLEVQIKNHLVDRLFTPGRVREILKGLHKIAVNQAKERGGLRQELQRKLGDTENKLRRIYTVIEEGALELSLLKDPLRELQQEKSGLQQQLATLPEPKGVPLACYSGPVIEKARKQLRDLFLAEDSRMAKAYLNFLVEKIILTGKQVHIEGKTARIAAMMNERPEKIASPASVPTADIGWLPGEGSNLRHGDYDLPSLPRG